MKTRGLLASIATTVFAMAGKFQKSRAGGVDLQVRKKTKSKGGGNGRGIILKAGRPMPTGTVIGNSGNQLSVIQKMQFMEPNWHSQNRAGFRGPRGTGHARRKCWR